MGNSLLKNYGCQTLKELYELYKQGAAPELRELVKNVEEIPHEQYRIKLKGPRSVLSFMTDIDMLKNKEPGVAHLILLDARMHPLLDLPVRLTSYGDLVRRIEGFPVASCIYISPFVMTARYPQHKDYHKRTREYMELFLQEVRETGISIVDELYEYDGCWKSKAFNQIVFDGTYNRYMSDLYGNGYQAEYFAQMKRRQKITAYPDGLSFLRVRADESIKGMNVLRDQKRISEIMRSGYMLQDRASVLYVLYDEQYNVIEVKRQFGDQFRTMLSLSYPHKHLFETQAAGVWVFCNRISGEKELNGHEKKQANKIINVCKALNEELFAISIITQEEVSYFYRNSEFEDILAAEPIRQREKKPKEDTKAPLKDKEESGNVPSIHSMTTLEHRQ